MRKSWLAFRFHKARRIGGSRLRAECGELGQRAFWKKLGAVSVMPSLELIKTVRFSDSGFSVIDETDGSEAAIESNFYGFGAVPLMISEHLLDEQDFIGKKGEHYCRIINEYGDKSLILKRDIFIP